MIDCVDRCILYSYITMQRVDAGVLGNMLRLRVLLNGKLTGLWEPELFSQEENFGRQPPSLSESTENGSWVGLPT